MSPTAETPRAVWCCSTCGAVYHKDFPRCPSDGAEVVMVDRDPLLGTAIGHYEIRALIGEGGMGRVYLADHATLPNRRHAIKVLLGDHAASAAMRTRFTREAERASQLDHPNIVQVVDFGRTDRGLLYIAMDYVEGPSLVTVIGDTPMAPRRVAAIAREICHALAYAHDAGIVHRDLKPENILISSGPAGEDIPRLVDFGLAMSIGSSDARLTESGMTMGTPAFAAPEQLSGRPIDHRADLYALGMTMFEMLSGGVPPVEGSMMEVVASRTTRDAPRLSERMPQLAIPAALDDIVAKLTRKKPAERYTSAREAAEVLAAMLDAPEQCEGVAPVSPAIESSPVSPPATSTDDSGVVTSARRPESRLSTQHVRPSRRRGLIAGVIAAAAIVVLLLARSRSSRPSLDPPVAAAPASPAAPVAIAPPAPATPVAPSSPPATPPPPVVEARIQPAPSPRSVEPPRLRLLLPQLSPVEVSGSLTPSEVQRAVDRQRAVIARCASATTSPATVTAQFSIGEARRARAIHTAGPVGALNACVRAALTDVRTASAPDIGDAQVTVRIAFAVTQ